MEPPSKKKRSSYTTDEQKNYLIEFMKQHPELHSGKFTSTFTNAHRSKLWAEVTDELNKIPGAVKDSEHWRKSWADIKRNTKNKNTTIRKSLNKTGGGPPTAEILTDLDQNVLSLIGPCAVDGHSKVEESNVQFCWNSDENCFTGMEFLNECQFDGIIPIVPSEHIEFTEKDVPASSPSENTESTGGSVAGAASHSDKKKGFKRTSVAQRQAATLEHTAKLASVFQASGH